ARDRVGEEARDRACDDLADALDLLEVRLQRLLAALVEDGQERAQATVAARDRVRRDAAGVGDAERGEQPGQGRVPLAGLDGGAQVLRALLVPALEGHERLLGEAEDVGDVLEEPDLDELAGALEAEAGDVHRAAATEEIDEPDELHAAGDPVRAA